MYDATRHSSSVSLVPNGSNRNKGGEIDCELAAFTARCGGVLLTYRYVTT